MTIPMIPLLRKEYIEGLSTLYPMRPDLYPFDGFAPDVLKEGSEWALDIKSTGMAAAKVSAVDTASQGVQDRPVGQLFAMPERVAEHYAFTQKKRDKLRKAGDEMARPDYNPDVPNAAVQAGEGIVGEAVELLTGRWRTLKSLRWSQVLQGRSVSVVGENGLTYTIDYSDLIELGDNPTALGEGGLGWDDASATIVRDIAAMKRAFRQAHGVRPNTVWCSADIEEYFLKNTDFLSWVKARYDGGVTDYLEGPAALPGNGGWRFMGLDWRPMSAKYQATDSNPDSLTDFWDQDTLLLGYIAPGERLFEYWQSDTDETDRTGGPVFDVSEDPNVKAAYRVRMHANGLPIIRAPHRLSLIADVTA